MPRLDIMRFTLVAVLLALVAVSCSRNPMDPVSRRANGAGTSPLDGENAGGGGPIVVMVQPGTDPMEVVASLDGTVLECHTTLGLVSLLPGPQAHHEDLVLALTQDERVLEVESERTFETAESRQRSFAFDDGLGSASAYAEQPAAGALGLGHAHTVSRGSGTLIAIIDTGADVSHPALAGSIAGGWDFIDRDADPREQLNGMDEDGDGDVDEAYGHGTHVAGIAHLVAPDAQLLILRVLDSDGRGSLLHVAAAVRWAVRNGARVINMSLGSLGHSPTLDRALAEAEAQGVLTVVSAGNWGGNTPVEFPASSPHVMAIAAVNTDHTPADFSSRGDFVELSAPGVGVRSTYPGGGYWLWSGTSMSAPFVAGAGALLAAVHPEWMLAAIRQQLGFTAAPIGAPANGMGAGSLDVGTAVAPTLTVDEPVPEEFRPR
jgi:hypothetical protein